ncbi:uncharacterized protein BP01DRAFT_134799 [Aspergillus saccharolyticus JOP 1030-1]|uniref:Uncharacterized protein n=1 Tax=Aspergillus saccharolyticus JOP 1030-1 TaxID=1450539 RepID=A0A318Z4X9_9EURO|nr:hypothetical protein BP01DRAFT_134799 [Aspergillus saccharolyticus JOP 1030-1]PYH42371.1 hypothetical protein BP01DRAFT_134799 [Aspergillus saccharolyticus JOP 1030-1]
MAGLTATFTRTATHLVHREHQICLPDPFVLVPFDQLQHHCIPINAAKFYESDSSGDLIPIDRQSRAISRVLDSYPQLTGRMHIDPDTDVRSVTRLETGVHLIN